MSMGNTFKIVNNILAPVQLEKESKILKTNLLKMVGNCILRLR